MGNEFSYFSNLIHIELKHLCVRVRRYFERYDDFLPLFRDLLDISAALLYPSSEIEYNGGSR